MSNHRTLQRPFRVNFGMVMQSGIILPGTSGAYKSQHPSVQMEEEDYRLSKVWAGLEEGGSREVDIG